ncbi:hypothetical protein Pst134EA_028026 [Puccinia striiformis f. sp. tritici]|nr:hypothetical protein Pst134EA_028026 [Puccinia striiformis f. sp. tritici]KAI9607849.1 hypothetical protein H4Q26_005297 [Puccinia striiformis f. sp. tritici PST-130]KNF03299.1 hypothetical protein PSTG_03567 [Puccinia striiformis f. sp. tritici PST-78]POV98713.1 hypothetical protein PSTT_14275 [Puccinia striiformis]KAH9442304.1 hypothetical protein Pst134EB_028558 [Puccinia striiformis f. sp. tritici]KAH9448733.1 hypothetical protein Pst134EA_028026 [Puccinia striiformis f. sp. tritici]
MAPRPRKRVRRRRATEQFDDSSSNSSSSGSESGASAKPTSNVKNPSASSESSSEDESSSDSSSSSSSSDSSLDQRPTAKRGRLAKKQAARTIAQQEDEAVTNNINGRSPSPVPQSPPPPLPSSYFDPDLALPYLDSSPQFNLPLGFESHSPLLSNTLLVEDEQKFRNWYMETIVDRFPNELDLLRSTSASSKNTTTTTNNQLEVLVAALGAGVDIFDDQVVLSSSNLVLDDHSLVLDTLKLHQQHQNHLDPSICSDHSLPPPEDIEMSNP